MGDVVLLQPGDLVPTDLQLVEARGLAVDEWEVTGEIAPVEKRLNGDDVRVYRGSRIIRGSGKGVVVATGNATEYQNIWQPARERIRRPLPPLLKARYLVLPALLAPPFVVYWSRRNGLAVVWLVALLAAGLLVLLQHGELFVHAVAACQLYALRRRKIQVHDAAILDTVQRLGVVCLDKTGVLTTREITVNCLHFTDSAPEGVSAPPAGAAADLTRLACALGNDVFHAERMQQSNAIDHALLAFATQNGVAPDVEMRNYTRIYDQPFDSENRYMVAGFERDGQTLFFAKGDPDVVLLKCSDYVAESGGRQPFDVNALLAMRQRAQIINQQGGIALALACQCGTTPIPPAHYTFLCLVHLENPLRAGVPDCVRALKEKGVRVVMLTGDRPEAALAVGRLAGIDSQPQACLSGKQIAAMALSDLALQSSYISIFARLLPSHKGVLVRALQQRHHTVAMVGDGTNDVIALRVADVAISFVEHSSVLAQWVADILINDLADLGAVIASAERIRWQSHGLAVARALVAAVILLGSYGWLLSQTR